MISGASKPERLRVLVFTSLFPTPEHRTHGVFKWQLVRELSDICDITVVCPLPWFPGWRPLRRFVRWYAYAAIPREYDVDGIRVHSPKYLMLPWISEPFQALLMFLGALSMVWRLHRRERFDLINSMWLYPDAVAAGFIGKLLGIPMVPTASGCDVNLMLKERGKRGQILAMLRRAPAITAVSEALRQTMASEGIPLSRIATTPNGVNGDLFFARDHSQARSELGLPENRRVVLYVGRFSEEKGLHTLIEAAGLLRQHRDDFLVYLVGDGPLSRELRAQVQALDLAKNVLFAGTQDHTAVAKWYGACDVFCLPSLREGCPNVLLEALSSGRPAVASRVGGIPDLLQEDCGILVEPLNAAALAAALDTALDRPWSAAVIAASMSRFTWRAAAENYHSTYLAVSRL